MAMAFHTPRHRSNRPPAARIPQGLAALMLAGLLALAPAQSGWAQEELTSDVAFAFRCVAAFAGLEQAYKAQNRPDRAARYGRMVRTVVNEHRLHHYESWQYQPLLDEVTAMINAGRTKRFNELRQSCEDRY